MTRALVHPILPPHRQLAFLRELQGLGQPPLVLIGHSIGCYMQHHALYRLEASDAAAAEDEARMRAIDDLAAEGEAGEAPASEEGRRKELLSALERERRYVREHQPVSGSSGGKIGSTNTDGSSGGNGTSSSGGGGQARPSNVRMVISLFPFLTIDPGSRKQAALRRLTSSHRLLGRAAAALGALPGPVKRAAVRLFDRQMDGHAVRTAAEMVHPATGEQTERKRRPTVGQRVPAVLLCRSTCVHVPLHPALTLRLIPAQSTTPSS